jgi:Txe/YoeB family toxin of toxin-antitoxin system
MYRVVFTKQAAKDAKKLKATGLDAKAKHLIALIEQDPFTSPPAFEALVGNLQGMYSRRINLQHRLVYTLDATPLTHEGKEFEGTVKVLRMWTHYENL